MPLQEGNGIQTYYESHGEGTPLLLIAGRALDHTSWAPQVKAYAPHFRTIVYDLRSVGRSTRTPPGYSIDDMAQDAEALLLGLGIGEAHIAGYSIGGTIALALALRKRVRLRSLSLHSTSDRAYPHVRWRREICLRILEIPDPELRSRLWASFTAFTAFGAEFLNAHEDIVKAEVERRVGQWNNPTAAQVEAQVNHLRAGLDYDMTARLGEIAVPTFISVGSSDDVAHPDYSRHMASRILGARLVVFDGAPHRSMVHMEEEFNRTSLSFLLDIERRIPNHGGKQ
jgi:pimeloyl-ACP methyl ester carboxylesterase